MTDLGKVSIITPSYNCAEFISETIKAIQAQTYTNWELLVTDDCSTDDSREVVERYALTDSRIHLFVLDENSGPGVARNNSIRNATGRFIAFCDSDDRWYPEKLEKQLKFMDDNGYTLTYTSYDTCDMSGNINGYVECPCSISYSDIIRDCGIGCLTAIYDAARIGKHYMPAIRRRQDWCLWIKIIKQTGYAKGIRESLAIYRIRQGSVSSNKLELIRYNFNVYHKVLGYNPVFSALLLGTYFIPYYIYKKTKQQVAYRLRRNKKIKSL